MPKSTSSRELTIDEVCDRTGLSPDDVAALCEVGLIAYVQTKLKRVYPSASLSVTQRLLKVAEAQHWDTPTLAWFADLCFASCIGRAVLLPLLRTADNNKRHFSANWLTRPNIESILGDFEKTLTGANESFINVVRSVVVMGESHFWSDQSNLVESSLYPIITTLEQSGIQILGQSQQMVRDASTASVAIVLTFTVIAQPISNELAELVESVRSTLESDDLLPSPQPISQSDQALILHESGIAVDQFYAVKRPEIHSQPDEWTIKDGSLTGEHKTIRVVLTLPDDLDGDNILALIRSYLGAYGARVVQALYEIANDEPYWRNPVITVDTNALLDRLGLKRSSRGPHSSDSRIRLRNVLNAAHNLEIIGKYTEWEDGKRVIKVIRRTVLSLIGATYDESEQEGIPADELLQRGLPKRIQIRLNFYDGVRQPNGLLGRRYVLLPRLGTSSMLENANYASTHEALSAYFLTRYRQTNNRVLNISRSAALDSASIRNKNARMATITLRKALDQLVNSNFLESYSPNLPRHADETFEVILSKSIINKL